MAVHGRVQNGVVVLDNGVRLPEGQEVTVLAHDTVAPARARSRARLQRAAADSGAAAGHGLAAVEVPGTLSVAASGPPTER